MKTTSERLKYASTESADSDLLCQAAAELESLTARVKELEAEADQKHAKAVELCDKLITERLRIGGMGVVLDDCKKAFVSLPLDSLGQHPETGHYFRDELIAAINAARKQP